MSPKTPHIYALEMYLRELRADGASSGTVRTAGIEGIEGILAEVEDLRRIAEKHAALVARVDKVGMSQIVVDEAIARYAGDGDRFGEHVKKNLLRGLLEGLGERVEFSIARDEMRAQHLVSATLYVIRPEAPAPLTLPAPPVKEIRP